MRAVVVDHSGPPDVMQLREVERPWPGTGELLVKVRAAGVNPVDCKFRNRADRAARWSLTCPFVPGFDVAGAVVELGDGCERFEVGDVVYAMLPLSKGGGYAEYAVVAESWASKQPANLSDQQAAATPLAALTALQGLRRAGVKAGSSVLINGGSGGVGTFVIQIAKAMGAEVTAVCGPHNIALVAELGASYIIDYTQENFTTRSTRWDAIFDAVGNLRFSHVRKSLYRRGTFLTILRTPAVERAAKWSRWLPGRRVDTFVVESIGKDLDDIGRWVREGVLTPVVGHVFKLEEVVEAHKLSESRHAQGKIVLTL